MSSPDYSQAVKDILDGLGDTPTPDEVYHAVKNYSVDNVVAATAAAAKAGAGAGGSQPVVYCMPGVDASIDVHTVGSYAFFWDALYASFTFAETLDAIPAGLGLTFAFNNTDENITATEDGVWAFTLAVNVPSTSLVGSFNLDGNQISQHVENVSGQVVLTSVLPLKSGDSLSPAWITTQGVGSTSSITPYLQIVRIG